MQLKNVIPWTRGGTAVPVRATLTPFAGIHRGMDDLFGEVLRGFDLEPFGGDGLRATMPSVDVVETDEALRVEVDLPGVEREDIEVTVGEGALVIRGERRIERDGEKGGWHRTERSHGIFHRAIPLPCEVDRDGVEARFARGVLTVTLPKAERERNRRIEVRSGD